MKFIEYAIFGFLASFLFSSDNYASCHVSDCDDQDFIDFGKKFPAVGCFSNDYNGGIFGSGTLVDLSIPALSGKVVITCAHIFYNSYTEQLIDASQEKITFTIDPEAPCEGTFHVHPLYADNYDTSYDIAVFILNTPIESVVPLQVDLDGHFESYLNKQYISSGFGRTSHVLGKYSIIDLHRRASYAYAHALPLDNPLEDIHMTVTTGTKELGQFSERKITRPKGSVLSLCPYIFSQISPRFVDEYNTLKTCSTPAGISDTGDSGGGCFAEDGKLVGIISQSSGDIANHLSEIQENEVYIDNVYFSKHEGALKRNLIAQKDYYESTMRSFEGKELSAFLKLCPPPQMPKVVSSEETNALAKPYYHVNLFDTRAPNRMYLSVSQEVTSVSFHKGWIMSVLEEEAKTKS